MLIKRRSAIERFWAKVQVDEATGCWNWTGSNSNGYGHFKAAGGRHGAKVGVYRFAWEYYNGRPMPEGLEADHTCNNPKCCNPKHIEPVTHAENQRRAAERRQAEGRRINYTPKPRPTHCPHGHEYTEDNTIHTVQNTIQCKECNRLRCNAYQARKRAVRTDPSAT